MGFCCKGDLPPLISLSIIASLQLLIFIMCRSLTILSLLLNLGRIRVFYPIGFRTLLFKRRSRDLLACTAHLRLWDFIVNTITGLLYNIRNSAKCLMRYYTLYEFFVGSNIFPQNQNRSLMCFMNIYVTRP